MTLPLTVAVSEAVALKDGVIVNDSVGLREGVPLGLVVAPAVPETVGVSDGEFVAVTDPLAVGV